MTDRVFVPLASGQWLALELDAFRQALEAGAALASQAPAAQTDEPLIDSDALAKVLSLPVTWIEQAAREGRIPCLRAGRWVRFRRSAVEGALSRDNRGAA